ncbi:hypothetical protein [Halomonas sp. MCCC 1A11062]|uniref:hypothetical protein n=1 Tax=Halomonas sp. MCCC 1A11062 TaxID=2733485 RepID=UPI001F3742C5|nr:hypothetical protein [Halomonas sp. MCCC 1A11062]MCE8036787.1 hypothetical protein [Halomonas sp. MCCC 1A11062]
MIRTSFFLAAGALIGLSGAVSADGSSGADAEHGAAADRALVILTSESLQTQGMAMILANAMQQQGTELSLLLCDAAGDLAVRSYASSAPINTPPENPAGQVTPEGMLQMLVNQGAQVDVCAIYLPNSDYAQSDLREGIGVAAPGRIAEMMRDLSIPVFSF